MMILLVISLLAAAPTPDPLPVARAHLEAGRLDEVFFALDGKNFEGAQAAQAADVMAAAAAKSLAAKDDVFALQFAQMALRLVKEHPGALEASARAQLAQKQFAGAEATADRWIAVTGGAEAILFRADLAFSQADWERAMALASSAGDRQLSPEQRQRAQRIIRGADAELTAAALAMAELQKLDRKLAEAQEQAAREERTTRLASASIASTRVIVYGFKGCGFCTRVMDYLRSKQIAFAYKDILEDKEANAEMWKKKNALGMRSGGVPVTDVDGTLIQGAKMPEIEQAVRSAGLLK